MTPPSAFEGLIRAHQATVWRYLRFLGCCPDEADDLTQETFLAVHDRPLHRFGAGAAAAYLRRVARNAFLKSKERERRARLVDLEAVDAAFDWFVRDDDGQGVRSALHACIDGLEDKARDALRLRFAEGLPRGAIARRLALTSHGVKSLLQRSYRRLRICVERRLRDA